MGRAKAKNMTIGIDEVGRGALAGPVVVVAALLSRENEISLHAPGNVVRFGKLKDSKKLSSRQREAWFGYFKNELRVAYVAARMYPRSIERINISRAANKAAYRAFTALIQQTAAAKNPDLRTVLDGGLYLHSRQKQEGMQISVKTMPKADETVPAVAVASIIAKVIRDRYMIKMSQQYHGYSFEIHKGYGTKLHMAALRKKGSSQMHRLTFLKKGL